MEAATNLTTAMPSFCEDFEDWCILQRKPLQDLGFLRVSCSLAIVIELGTRHISPFFFLFAKVFLIN